MVILYEHDLDVFVLWNVENALLSLIRLGISNSSYLVEVSPQSSHGSSPAATVTLMIYKHSRLKIDERVFYDANNMSFKMSRDETSRTYQLKLDILDLESTN